MGLTHTKMALTGHTAPHHTSTQPPPARLQISECVWGAGSGLWQWCNGTRNRIDLGKKKRSLERFHGRGWAGLGWNSRCVGYGVVWTDNGEQMINNVMEPAHGVAPLLTPSPQGDGGAYPPLWCCGQGQTPHIAPWEETQQWGATPPTNRKAATVRVALLGAVSFGCMCGHADGRD